MKIDMLERRLAKAEDAVRLGEKHIQRQRDIVAVLEADGLETDLALRLLTTFEENQQTHIADRDRIAQEIADLMRA